MSFAALARRSRGTLGRLIQFGVRVYSIFDCKRSVSRKRYIQKTKYLESAVAATTDARVRALRRPGEVRDRSFNAGLT